MHMFHFIIHAEIADKHFSSERKHLIRFLCFIFCFCCMTSAYCQSAQVIASELLASTVMLELRDASGRPSHGTGFFIGTGIVATNAHVIDTAVSGSARLVNTHTSMTIHGYIALDTDTDVAVLVVSDDTVPSVSIGDSDTVRIGDLVYTVGNPRGLEGTFSEGRISSIREIPDIKGKVIQFTAAISHGSSGGALVNQSGQVIGIASQTRHDGQNLNFAIPINQLKRVMESATTLTPLHQQDTRTEAQPQNTQPILIFILTGVIGFGVLYFLPSVKSEKIGYTLTLATFIAALRTIPMLWIPIFFTEQMQHLFYETLWDETLIHILACRNCLPVLLMKLVILQAYLIALSLCLAIANRFIPKIQIAGFFNTAGIALLIIAAEIVITQLLPWM